MSDCYGAFLHLPVRFIEGEVADEIKGEFNVDDEDLKQQRLRDNNSGIGVFDTGDAVNGRFESLENTLVSYGVPFIRYSDGYYGLDPVARVYRPETIDGVCGIDVEKETNEAGQRYILLSEIESFIGLPPQEAKRKLRQAVAKVYPDSNSDLKDWATGNIRGLVEVIISLESGKEGQDVARQYARRLFEAIDDKRKDRVLQALINVGAKFGLKNIETKASSILVARRLVGEKICA